MKFAIATDDGSVSGHFGRCQEYRIVDIEGGEVQGEEVTGNPGHEPGALPKLMSELGVSCVVCGGAGPRAVGLLAEAGIDLLQGVSGPVEEVVAKLASGEIEGGESACHH